MLVILRFGDESALIIDSMKYCHYITLKRFHSIGSQILSYQPVKYCEYDDIGSNPNLSHRKTDSGNFEF